MSDTALAIVSFIVLIPSIVLHEVAHGYVSYRLGDPTAKMAGRLTLNPIAHADPFGSVLLPGLMAITGAPMLGWAKPVPINPRYYRDYRKGMLFTGLAGPATNVTLAIAAGVVARLLEIGNTGAQIAGLNLLMRDGPTTTLGVLWLVLYMVVVINLVLVFFNLIPIPPLDGSRVLPLFLSDEALKRYHAFERQGLAIVLLLAVGLPFVLNVHPISWYFDHTVFPIARFLLGI